NVGSPRLDRGRQAGRPARARRSDRANPIPLRAQPGRDRGPRRRDRARAPGLRREGRLTLSQRLAGLDAIGVGPDGVNRLAWTDEAAACAAWFGRQAAGAGLRAESDPAGNLWAL